MLFVKVLAMTPQQVFIFYAFAVEMLTVALTEVQRQVELYSKKWSGSSGVDREAYCGKVPTISTQA